MAKGRKEGRKEEAEGKGEKRSVLLAVYSTCCYLF